MLKISTIKEKILFSNEWVSLREKDGYSYLHEDRCNGEIVVVLGYRNQEVLGRFEKTPCHSNKTELTSLTGGVEEGNSPKETAKMELEEEAGIKAELSRFKELGTLRPTKSSDTTVYIFAIELKEDEEPVENPEGDGSEGEKGAYCEWVSLKEAINCKDPLVHAAILRADIL